MKRFWNWLKVNVFVKDMFIYILIAGIIFYIPAWGAIILGYVLNNNFIYAFAPTYILIWAGPFTPTIPAILGIAVFLKQVHKRITRRSDKDETV